MEITKNLVCFSHVQIQDGGGDVDGIGTRIKVGPRKWTLMRIKRPKSHQFNTRWDCWEPALNGFVCKEWGMGGGPVSNLK